ncbi:hypothetical protein [Nocardiopsis lambiniae]|uniref:Uncharacterized protein n=1 Tax=Nocardiopsis lambiniae TaxID=3075539 RepID=A0ABU2MF59_9ACTN|nr:hypothetical protein [Nocardiopsis sp. DSM 44743]MDT0331338.1 hypothetical protein [Nocardiopsis sp. DSM 44743]
MRFERLAARLGERFGRTCDVDRYVQDASIHPPGGTASSTTSDPAGGRPGASAP